MQNEKQSIFDSPWYNIQITKNLIHAYGNCILLTSDVLLKPLITCPLNVCLWTLTFQHCLQKGSLSFIKLLMDTNLGPSFDIHIGTLELNCRRRGSVSSDPFRLSTVLRCQLCCSQITWDEGCLNASYWLGPSTH